jgi:ABC-type transport system involved in multi-copper enzyme maturation permease subunit
MLRPVAVLLVLITGLALACVYLPFTWLAGLFGLLGLLVLARVRLQGVGVLGPVFHAELLRSTRRSRTWLLRFLYLGIVLAVLLQVYSSLWGWRGPGWEPTLSDLAHFTRTLFHAFLVVQLVALMVLTPALTAGAIAEERERQSMTFLLSSDLRDHEIVLGKFAARLVHLLGLVLVGLPVFSAMQLLGGIDLGLVAICFAGTLMTGLGIASIGLLTSVLCRKSRNAIFLAYLIVVAYLVFSGLFDQQLWMHDLRHYPSTDTWTSPVEMKDILAAVTLGHPGYGMIRLGAAGSGTEALTVLGGYALFHAVLAALCVGLSLILLRRVGVGEAAPKPARVKERVRPDRPVGDDPILWREVWTERGWSGSFGLHAMVIVIVLASLMLVDWHVWRFGSDMIARQINGWARFLSATLGSLMLVQVTLRASGAIRGERDHETLDALLTTPLLSTEILYGKWVGALAGARVLGTGLVTVWMVALLTRGLHPLAILCQAFAWLIFAGSLAALGLWISVTATSSLRAAVTAVGLGLVLSFGHWAVWVCLCVPYAVDLRALEPVFFFQIGLTPPLAIGGAFGFWEEELSRYGPMGERMGTIVSMAILALLCWFMLGLGMWGAALTRFRELFHRKEEERGTPGVPRSGGSEPVAQ